MSECGPEACKSLTKYSVWSVLGLKKMQTFLEGISMDKNEMEYEDIFVYQGLRRFVL